MKEQDRKELPTRLYVKQYTRKEWKGFSLEIQEQLCKRYSIFLVDRKDGKITPAKQNLNEFVHQPKKDIARQILQNINKTNLDRAIKIIHTSTDKISSSANKIKF